MNSLWSPRTVSITLQERTYKLLKLLINSLFVRAAPPASSSHLCPFFSHLSFSLFQPPKGREDTWGLSESLTSLRCCHVIPDKQRCFWNWGPRKRKQQNQMSEKNKPAWQELRKRMNKEVEKQNKTGPRHTDHDWTLRKKIVVFIFYSFIVFILQTLVSWAWLSIDHGKGN